MGGRQELSGWEGLCQNCQIVNDTAERGVKMAEDYATILTKDDAMRAMILQGVESNRAKYLDFKKSTLNV